MEAPRTPGGAQFCGHCSQQLEGAAACPACGWRDPARIPHNCTRCKACSVRGLNFCPNCGAACWNKMQRTAPAVTPLSDDVLALADNPWPRGVEEGSTVCIGCSTRVDLRFCPGCGKEDRTENQTLRLKKSWTNALPSSWADSMRAAAGLRPAAAGPDLGQQALPGEIPEHFLNYYVRLCARATADEDEEGAQHAWDNLSMAVDNEERTVAVAFRMFDKDRSSKLDLEELQFMLQYIGLPSSLEDAEALLRRTDTDSGNNDMSISFEEFLLYVGEMGGCRNLVQGRREQIESRLPFKRRRRRSQENRLLVNSQDPAQAQVVSPEEHSPVRNKSSRLNPGRLAPGSPGGAQGRRTTPPGPQVPS
ncbi:unnamed protein product [Prorocentrum cordatum]|uniref:EF-hand domain-containing protein n=1 Tax=Prorocentrum cordatum TaxID=2364126 RepID=A0ABN9R108_9DINO|nr:unnamed protein product [Polarella glacialis]